MITVHHLNNSRSQRILWLLEELGVTYEVNRYQRHPVTMMAPPELKKIHPLGKSPVVTDDDVTLAESGAVIEYLVDKYGDGRLRPAAGTADRNRYNFFMHYAEGSVMPPLLVSLIFSRIGRAPMPLPLRPFGRLIEMGVRRNFITPQLKTHFDFMETELGARSWFAGQDFSAADIQMSFAVEAGSVRFGFADRPHLANFLQRIHSRPAYQKALSVGGPFSLG